MVLKLNFFMQTIIIPYFSDFGMKRDPKYHISSPFHKSHPVLRPQWSILVVLH